MLFSLRYRIEVRGLKELSLDLKKGVLFLPNHVSHIDPFFYAMLLWPKYRIGVVLSAGALGEPVYHFFSRFVKSTSLPPLHNFHNPLRAERVHRIIAELCSDLQEKGEKVLLFPSGTLKMSGKEELRGKSIAHTLLQQCPDLQVVLVRSTGLWGSIFSRAFSGGRHPNLGKNFLAAGRTILCNLIFFSPRRKVVFEFAQPPRALYEGKERLQINRSLEKWYNQYLTAKGREETEPLQLVSSRIWYRSFSQPLVKEEPVSGEKPSIPPEAREEVVKELRRILKRPDFEIREEMELGRDLGMDSLDQIELQAALLQKFPFAVRAFQVEWHTVRDVLEFAAGACPSRQAPFFKPLFAWPKRERRAKVHFPSGKTISAVFLKSCWRNGSSSACADISHLYDYRKLKRKALALAFVFRRLKGERIGVIYSPSVNACVLFYALMLSKKVPVLLNWALGSRALEEMMNLSGVMEIVSASNVLEAIPFFDPKVLSGKEVLLFNEIEDKISIREEVKAFLLSLCPPRLILRFLGLSKIAEDSHAVFLFTSGTEGRSKCVPLSHKNLLENQRVAVRVCSLKESDVMYGILPLFHAFGLSLSLLSPIHCGVRVFFPPNPLNPFSRIQDIQHWGITVFLSTPDYLQEFVALSKNEELSPIRTFIVGGDRASSKLYEEIFQRTQGVLFHGYGTTECAPLLTLNYFNSPSKGVGCPIVGVEICTIHPETLERLPQGVEGEICARGPNVFEGYLGGGPSPFIEIEGNRWYRTGDLGYLDAEGTLFLSGRLKRFVKKGGERVSLEAMEEVLETELRRYEQRKEQRRLVAICAEEEGDKTRLVLFTTVALSVEEANQVLQASTLRPLLRISAAVKVPAIPYLASGKVNIQLLKEIFLLKKQGEEIESRKGGCHVDRSV